MDENGDRSGAPEASLIIRSPASLICTFLHRSLDNVTDITLWERSSCDVMVRRMSNVVITFPS